MFPKVSVILPVYNAENYLDKCLKSILDQALGDIEIICINDGSTDSSLEILRRYELADPRVLVISQKNAGAGVARNVGLNLAKGKYLSFLDADDWFSPSMLKLAYERANETDADICIYQSIQFNESTNESRPITWAFNEKCIPRREVFSHADIPEYFFQCFMGWAWDKLFRTEFIRSSNILFPPLHNSEDQAFVYEALVVAARISVLRKSLLTQRTGNSESLSCNRIQNPLCFYKSLLLLKQFLIDSNTFILLRNSFINWAMEYTYWNLLTLPEKEEKECIEFLGREGIFRLGLDTPTASQFYNKRKFYKLRGLLNSPNISLLKRWSQGNRMTLVDGIFYHELSIIVPIYNVENYLEQCIKSLLSQQNIDRYEIIFINDGSSDSSVNILSEYQYKHPHITIINQKNKGLADARNAGLSIARGRYIGFVDSDDFVNPTMFEELVRALKESRADMAVCGVSLEPEQGFCPKSQQEYASYLKIKKNEICKIRSKSYNKINCPVWNKIYKKSILEQFQIKFPSGIFYEDQVFTKKYILHCHKYVTLQKPLYHYRLRSGSIMNSGNNLLKKSWDHINAVKLAFQDILESKNKHYWMREFFLFLHLETIHALESSIPECRESIMKEIKDFLKVAKFFQNKKYLKKRQINFFLDVLTGQQSTDPRTLWKQFKKTK